MPGLGSCFSQVPTERCWKWGGGKPLIQTHASGELGCLQRAVPPTLQKPWADSNVYTVPTDSGENRIWTVFPVLKTVVENSGFSTKAGKQLLMEKQQSHYVGLGFLSSHYRRLLLIHQLLWLMLVQSSVPSPRVISRQSQCTSVFTNKVFTKPGKKIIKFWCQKI